MTKREAVRLVAQSALDHWRRLAGELNAAIWEAAPQWNRKRRGRRRMWQHRRALRRRAG